MKFTGKPRSCDAWPITKTYPRSDQSHGEDQSNGGMIVELSDGRAIVLTAAMLARYVPEPGDYYVQADDGYTYVNPKHVFESHWF